MQRGCTASSRRWSKRGRELRRDRRENWTIGRSSRMGAAFIVARE